MEGDTITPQNQVIRSKTKMFNFKTTQVQVPASSIVQVQHQMENTFFTIQKGSTCHQQFRTGSTNKDCNSSACASNNKKIIYKKHSKCTISRRTSLLHSCLGKITQGHETLSTVNGYKIQGYHSPFLEKILQLTKMSKE